MKLCNAHWLLIAVIIALGILNLLMIGCGQTGDLYLPEDTTQQEQQ